ncbi:type II toxin-antitoxin system RelE/ParE family toxin [Massilia sp. YIM B02763]|uniref:type II toxin-antitoxin system RelE/ParE family toxin n=1 Tax=Massilia sp. YIM B02763 TaxID=3050130 RepID=UPI0025B679B3|nr:type II toxin-antitoxin system RelE/ParE family toxin [Massilia sp. YIM B02763]MDN4052521.1 type II toxin-antitoxin system RelE/ParE family toxin [Massilia sp. YIM B02763]
MLKIVITDAAKDDLDRLYDVDEDAAAEIETALDEIAHDPLLLERLTEKKFKSIGTPEFDVDVFEELWKRGLNLLRLKFWDWQGSVVSHRVLYAYAPRTDIYYVLAVVERNYAYDTKHPTVLRVIRQYDALGLHTY